MSIGIYLDEHVPDAIAVGLRERDVDVLTTRGDQHAGKSDAELLERATQLGRLIFTHDKHFLKEASRRQRNGLFFSGVIYARQMNWSIGQLIDELELIAKAGRIEELHNCVEFL